MTVFIDEPGPDGEPTLWALENGDTDYYQYTYLLSRVDLLPDVRRFWPDVVTRMTGTVVTNNDVGTIAAAIYYWTGTKAGARDGQWEGSQFTGYYTEAARAVLAALTGVPHD